MLFYQITLINWVINADFIIRHLYVFIFYYQFMYVWLISSILNEL
jgi:hypothetical protein